MSRGVRDLRDLICVSRLTVRDSDDEIISDEEDNEVTKTFDKLSLGSSNGSRENSAQLHQRKSPDSGFATNGASPELESTSSRHRPHPPASQLPTNARKKRRRKRKPLEAKSAIDTLSARPRHGLPGPAPLPPVRSDTLASWSSSSSEGPPGGATGVQATRTNFDQLLMYMDPTIVSEWLQLANQAAADLASWCNHADRFVQFAHFWLSDFPGAQRLDIFRLEHGILLDQLSLAFAAGREGGQVKLADLRTFLGAVFREYPAQLLSSKGPHLFLDHLDVLSSERQQCYKQLLSNVKVSTRNKQHAQWCLAVRAFSLISVWTAVVNFYRRLVTSGSTTQALPLPAGSSHRGNIHAQRIYQAIRNGYVDVVNYYIATGKVPPDFVDDYGKTLVFTTVMHRQPRILQYLLTQVKPTPNVNAAADTGNTPLHAAANNGSAALVEMLVKAPGVDIDPVNPQCDNATPLHLAVLHGHTEVVCLLVRAGADQRALMDGQTPADIARAFGHQDLLKMLQPQS